MKKSTMRVWLWFTVIGLILIALILPAIGTRNIHHAKAKITFTHDEAKKIATLLKQRADETGGLTNIDNGFVFQSLFGASGHYYYDNRTNEQGELLDPWQTPYQIEILAQTNFVVRSAGPNKNFGDVDDIIFNSISNDFVKP